MALDPIVYKTTETLFAVIAESTVGDKVVASMQGINISAMPTVRTEVVKVFDIRSGSGRIARIADALICKKAVIREIDVPVVLDQTTRAMFLSNVMTDTVASGRYNLAYNYTPPELADGDASGITKTLTCAIVSPEAGKSRIFPGCTLVKYREEFDREVENGRYRATLTFRTGYIPSEDQATPSFTSPFYPSTYIYGSDMDDTEGNGTVRTIASVANVLIKSLALEISNPAFYLGTQGANGDPQVITRATEEEGLKMGKLAQPLRVALTGRTTSPGIYEVMELLGQDRTVTRLEGVLSSIGR